ncbi:MAG: ABC transporter ATP-binding protein, partial [Clostridia bacterium]
MAMGKQAVTGREKPVEIRKTLKRVLSYLTEYKLQIVVVLICIVFSAVAGVFATALLQPLLDNLVEKGILVEEKMTTLITTVVTMACIYLVGAVSNFFVNRLMLNISTEALFKIRRDLFAHMEKLPIKFFDTNTHGNLMTRYTNDTDSLNDMIRQSIPQLISSALTLITVVVMMIRLSWILTLVIALMSVIMIVFLKVIGGKSQRNFITYQKSIGSVNGYMEEMMEGQRVVKVFNHEDKVMERFEVINDELCESATKANTYANILMPIMGNLTHMFYALIAIVGVVTALAFPEQNLISIGTLATFLLYVRSFAQPIQQSSQQLNMIFGAVAGAQRVFEVIDEPVEVDDGYVTLVNANISKDGIISESENQTEHWAWKHPHKADGTVTYTEVKGEVTFDNVVFGYEPNKIVLRGISLYALEGQKIAFVGSTGAGKTTITNLLYRLGKINNQ